ncbi:lymphatic vessel endothelial hyaluronic receptor 1b [Trichomycterus rosablanca]|uniref:lymphatic vessel endothelial hyaluronic receptor 1b n=1 Tax=Trichomycterus rosablanca TaxID=2290929 RepID=UPI002F35CC7D
MSKQYSFNATQAVEVCSNLSVRIATRDQVESAYNNGLQTCRYGWIEEQVAVIPRIEKNDKCGQSKTGVLVWRAPPAKLFDVFCYNSTAQSEASTTTTPSTTAPNETPHAKTTSLLLIMSTLFNKNILTSSPSAQSSSFSTSTKSKLFPSTISSVNTRSPRSSPPSTAQFSIQYQLFTSSLIPLKPSIVSTSSVSHSSSMTSITSTSFSSTSLSLHLFTHSSFLTVSTNQTDHTQSPQSLDTRRFYFGEVALACIIIAAMLFLMAGLGAVWYFKIKRSHHLPSWVRIRTKDMFETEMYTEQEHYSKQNKNKSCADDITLMMEEYSEPC